MLVDVTDGRHEHDGARHSRRGADPRRAGRAAEARASRGRGGDRARGRCRRDDHDPVDVGDDASRPPSRKLRPARRAGSRSTCSATAAVTQALIDEACEHGYSALVLTVDVPILGRREGAVRSRLPHSGRVRGRRRHLRRHRPERQLARPRVARRARAAGRAQGRADDRGRAARASSTARRRSSCPTTAGASSTACRRRSTRCPRVVEAVARACRGAPRQRRAPRRRRAARASRSARGRCSSAARSCTRSPRPERRASCTSCGCCAKRWSSGCGCSAARPSAEVYAGARRMDTRDPRAARRERLQRASARERRRRRAGAAHAHEARTRHARSDARVVGDPIDLCVTSEFERTRQTADLALEGRDVPRLVVPELNDPLYGSYEGGALEDVPLVGRLAPASDDEVPGGGESRRQHHRAIRARLPDSCSSAPSGCGSSSPIRCRSRTCSPRATATLPAAPRAARRARARVQVRRRRARTRGDAPGGLVRRANLVKLARRRLAPSLGGAGARRLRRAPLAAPRASAARLAATPGWMPGPSEDPPPLRGDVRCTPTSPMP